jgi:hypothetical protein
MPELTVVAWRRRRLLDAGFGWDLADELAAEPRMDLHALLQLVERGCPPSLAARILSPADDGWVLR